MSQARLQAELYALTHRGTRGDAQFYEQISARAERVLELGCGYGRLLSVLARPGRVVTGLELDPDLLALARRNLRALGAAKRASVRLVHADMRAFELGRRFDCVLLPYNGLYCLLTKRDALACFRAARSALEPGGQLVLDVWNPEELRSEPSEAARGPRREHVVTLQHAGRTWDVFERSRLRRAAQRLEVTYEYLPRERGAPCATAIPQRYYGVTELVPMLARAGFSVARCYGSFSRKRFTPHSEQLIIVARAS